MRVEKPVVWLSGEVKTPPFSEQARIEAGRMLRSLQKSEMLSLPHSRPLPSIGAKCHELRVRDENVTWRIIYRLDADAVVILEVFAKKTQALPQHIIDACKRRLTAYDQITESEHGRQQAGAPGSGRLEGGHGRRLPRPFARRE